MERGRGENTETEENGYKFFHVTHNDDHMKKNVELWTECLRKHGPTIPYNSVVFAAGTHVRLDCTTHEEEMPANGFHDESVMCSYLSGYPDHRFENFSESQEEIFKKTKNIFDWSQTFPEQMAKDCRRAYAHLITSGYPFPGNMGADRTVYPFSRDLWLVIFCELVRGDCCATIVTNQEPVSEEEKDSSGYVPSREELGRADFIGAENRRIDYMFPQPFAHISKKLEITFFRPSCIKKPSKPIENGSTENE